MDKFKGQLNKDMYWNIIFLTLVIVVPSIFIHSFVLEFMKVSWCLMTLILLQKIDFEELKSEDLRTKK